MLTVNRVLKDDEISRIADSIIALQESEDTTIPALKKQLADAERGIENMLNAIQQGILTSSTKERLETLERQRESANRYCSGRITEAEVHEGADCELDQPVQIW